MINRLVEILKKKHIRKALRNIQLEGGRVPAKDLLAIDDYLEGRISREKFVSKIINNVPVRNVNLEQEAEEIGLTGKAKDLYADWQTDKMTTDEYVQEILKDIGLVK